MPSLQSKFYVVMIKEIVDLYLNYENCKKKILYRLSCNQILHTSINLLGGSFMYFFLFIKQLVIEIPQCPLEKSFQNE